MKKLIPALCMLLVAAALLGTSTFAWFSMNTTVEANGMKVQAITSKNLVISANNTVGDSEDVKATHALNGKTAVMTPVSVQTLKNASANFFKVDNATASNVVFADGTAGNGTAFIAADNGKDGTTVPPEATFSADYIKYTFYVRANGEYGAQFAKFYVKDIKVTAAAEISKALRVGVVCGNNGFIYAPVTDATTTYKGVVKAGTVGTDADLFDDVQISTINTSTDTLGAVTTAYSTVDIYVWYEGQDAACTSSNSINVEALDIAVEFEALEA